MLELLCFFFFFKQKTAYEMRISDWSSDVCSSDLTQVDPENPGRPFSHRNLIGCLKTGAERFGWSARSAQPGKVREGRWLVGMGVAAAFRNNLLTKSAARVGLDRRGMIMVETDMTDIGKIGRAPV